MSDPNLSSFLWSVADLLRGDYRQSEYGKVILPFTVLRRLDCLLGPTKSAVLAELARREKAKLNPEPFLLRKSGQLFYNTSPLDLKKLVGDQDHVGENLRAYIQAFSPATLVRPSNVHSGWSACRPTCSTTPASALTCGSSATASHRCARARCN